jgi:hypothetical protein
VTEQDPSDQRDDTQRTPVEVRVFGVMQYLLSQLASGAPLEVPEPRGVVELQDALDALLQVGGVLDRLTQAGAMPTSQGVHASAMLMVIREYLRPLPPEVVNGTDRLTGDLQELVAALRVAREATGLHG